MPGNEDDHCSGEEVHWYINPRQDQTLIILDFDDTLFPTSLYDELGSDDPKLWACAASALALVAQSALYAKVVVCSNGNLTWLNAALSEPAYHQLRGFMQANDIPVISAMDLAGMRGLLDHSPDVWKRAGFAEIIAHYHEHDIMPFRVVSVGDATRDLSALETNRGYLEGATLVKVKLKSEPSTSELVEEHKALLSSFGAILTEEVCENHQMEFGIDGNAHLTAVKDPDIEDPQTYFATYDKDTATICRPTPTPNDTIAMVNLWDALADGEGESEGEGEGEGDSYDGAEGGKRKWGADGWLAAKRHCGEWGGQGGGSDQSDEEAEDEGEDAEEEDFEEEEDDE
ncbi:unnamed protein product [Vitrella brassicaformis CCMP3155]|uniref:Uncharacterized protein n=1 Tax=Vitrella brassicaformis (strain CCMP3155) TaxID=1169540 RepID=A0A0G4EDA3_VITBC|nr:unnamed protein product [Vitrella brassicaformis CCMP3155]|eukprot:CEL93332.1 unnamed protein product [Vitrella brassicaformis CCMP3155]